MLVSWVSKRKKALSLCVCVCFPWYHSDTFPTGGGLIKVRWRDLPKVGKYSLHPEIRASFILALFLRTKSSVYRPVLFF